MHFHCRPSGEQRHSDRSSRRAELLLLRGNRCWKEQRSIFPWTAELVLNTVLQGTPCSITARSAVHKPIRVKTLDVESSIHLMVYGKGRREGSESAAAVF